MPFYFNILVFLVVVMGVMVINERVIVPRRALAERLGAIKKMDTEAEVENELTRPFYERVLLPLYRRVGETLGSLAPRELRAKIEEKITYAGHPYNLNFNSFIALQALLGLALPGFYWLLTLLIGAAVSFLIILMLAFIGAYIPFVILSGRAQRRQLYIQRALPDMLDLLLVSVEAGLGFDMALKRVADMMPGVIGKELNRALEEIRMGKSREEALRGIVKRTGVADLSSFITAIIQAEQLGSNITKTLRVQAESMRHKRRQRAQETAMKAPVKMLFPLILFIFPALFVVILGPAAIRIFEMFATMM